jgi:hypothetical protein
MFVGATVSFARCVNYIGNVLSVATIIQIVNCNWTASMRVSLPYILILAAVTIALLLVCLPGEIRRSVATAGPYLFSRQFFADMVARLSGPGRIRFILQPAVAIFFGIRDGVRDARVRRPPFLSALLFHKTHRSELLRGALASVQVLVSVAIVLDMISQFLIFRRVHLGAALLLGPVLIGVPYGVSRALANRAAREHGRPPSLSRPI